MHRPGNICPTCGGKIAAPSDDVRVCLETWCVLRGGLVVRVSPSRAVLLDALNKARPRVLRRMAAIHAVWGFNEPEWVDSTLSVHICRLRKEIAPLGLEVITEFSVGWRLVVGALAVPELARAS